MQHGTVYVRVCLVAVVFCSARLPCNCTHDGRLAGRKHTHTHTQVYGVHECSCTCASCPAGCDRYVKVGFGAGAAELAVRTPPTDTRASVSATTPTGVAARPRETASVRNRAGQVSPTGGDGCSSFDDDDDDDDVADFNLGRAGAAAKHVTPRYLHRPHRYQPGCASAACSDGARQDNWQRAYVVLSAWTASWAGACAGVWCGPFFLASHGGADIPLRQLPRHRAAADFRPAHTSGRRHRAVRPSVRPSVLVLICSTGPRRTVAAPPALAWRRRFCSVTGAGPTPKIGAGRANGSAGAPVGWRWPDVGLRFVRRRRALSSRQARLTYR